MSRRHWILIALLAALWGASYLFIKLALEDLSPAMIVFVRTALAALVLAPLAWRAGAFGALRGRAGSVTVLGLLQVAGPFVLITVGEQSISSSLTGILVASAPIWTALLAIFIDQDERSRGWSLVGIAAGIVGVGVLLGVDVGGEAGALLGGAMVLLAGLGYALGGFYVKHRLRGVQPTGAAAAAMAVSAAALLPFALLSAPSAPPGSGAVAAVVALGVGGTGAAFFIFYTLIGEVGPARASIVAYIAPGFAVVYGVVLLGEAFTLATLAGLALICGGSWLAGEGRLPARRSRSHAATAPDVPPSPIAAPERRAA